MQFYISFDVCGGFYDISSKWEGETTIIFMYNYDKKYMMHYVSMKMLQRKTMRE